MERRGQKVRLEDQVCIVELSWAVHKQTQKGVVGPLIHHTSWEPAWCAVPGQVLLEYREGYSGSCSQGAHRLVGVTAMTIIKVQEAPSLPVSAD